MLMYSKHRLALAVVLVQAGALWTSAGMADAKDCSLQIYDQPEFSGNRIEIRGPAQLSSLKDLDGQDWSNRIESLKVGSNGEVTAFRRENFDNEPDTPVNHPHALKAWGAERELPSYQELEITLGPGKSEHHLADLNFHKSINSLKLRCLN